MATTVNIIEFMLTDLLSKFCWKQTIDSHLLFVVTGNLSFVISHSFQCGKVNFFYTDI